MALADARAMLPSLGSAPADVEAEALALRRLADWCTRYTPWAGVDGADGLLLDISGCAHLFGGEAAMLDEIRHRFRAMGVRCRLGLADTPGAAWAVARYGGTQRIVAPGGVAAALADLPVEALRLDADAVLLLQRLGLTTIGLVQAIPRATLVRRFPGRLPEQDPGLRLDQAFGRRDEPISPSEPPPTYRIWSAPAEPLLEAAQVEALFPRLLEQLCALLEQDGMGVRRLALIGYRADGSTVRADIGVGLPSRDAAHLARLFAPRLQQIEPGFGIDGLLLNALVVQKQDAAQVSLAEQADDASALAQLVDRLANRLGPGRVHRMAAVQSHVPERAVRPVTAAQPGTPWPHAAPLGSGRPLLLFARPEPVQVMAQVPDAPPASFTWRRVPRRVRHAQGPERIAAEWWLTPQGVGGRTRDYYRVEDVAGRRYWLYRDGIYEEPQKGEPLWYVHGLFA